MTTYGPNTAAVQRVIDQAARLPKFTEENRDSWAAAWATARGAAWDAWGDAGAAGSAAWAARDAAWGAGSAAGDAAWDAAQAAAAAVVADLITPEQYAAITAPWQVWVDAFGLDGDS